MKRKITAVIMTIVLIVGCSATAFIAFADDSGTCGSSVNWSFDSTTGSLVISGSGDMYDYNSIDDVPWHTIGETGIRNSITNVTVAENVTSVGAYAFSDLPNLSSVLLPSTVLKISPKAFLEVPELNSFTISAANSKYSVLSGKAIVESGMILVRYCPKSSSTVTIPNNIKIIGDFAFQGCTALGKVEFGSGVEIIRDYAFYGCKFSSITFPDNVRSIGAYAFAGVPLTSLTLSMQINSVGNNAFENCTSLKKLTIGNPVVDIGQNAFSGCTAVTEFQYYGDSANWNRINASNRVISKTPAIGNRTVLCYDANGGLGAPANVESPTTGSIISSVKPVSLDDSLAFKGWTETKGGSPADFNPGDTYGKNTSTHLYAIWGEGIYSVTYNANGGSGVPDPSVYSTVQNHTVTSIVPTRNDWQFDGWAYNKDAVSGTYHSGDVIKVDKEITLYAIWVNNGPYDIAFSASGANAGTVPSKIVKTKGVSITIPTLIPAKDRYTFNYWYCSADGKKYYPGDTFTLDKDVTLVARWTFNGPCKISFSPSNGIDADTPSQTYNIGQTLNIPAMPALKQDCTFLYWVDNYYDDDGNNHYVKYNPGDLYTATHDAVITAVWEKINYAAGTTLSLAETVEKTVNYKNKLHINVTAYNIPQGYKLALYRSDSREPLQLVVSNGGNATVDFTTIELETTTYYTVKVLDKDNNDCKNANNRPLRSNITVIVKDNIFMRIIAFFRSIFGGQPTVEL